MGSFNKIFKILFVLCISLLITGCSNFETNLELIGIEVLNQNVNLEKETEENKDVTQNYANISLENIPEYDDKPYVVINNNIPFFTEDEITNVSYEMYEELDELKRCGVATASIGKDLMPTEERGNIGSVKPTGWHSTKYDNVDGKYLYNRCHLIGFQLTGENANERNLITGTRYMNVQGMLPFENMVADYVKETNNHVMYRVTPVFEADNLVASGVLMEAQSVEDNGDGVLFNVYCYNVQPGIEIYYETGESFEDFHTNGSSDSNEKENINTYILNTNTKKFHYETCSSAIEMSEKNKQTYKGTRKDLVLQGYSACGSCKP